MPVSYRYRETCQQHCQKVSRNIPGLGIPTLYRLWYNQGMGSNDTRTGKDEMKTELTPGFRDAIHVPFIIVTSDCPVQPGEKLCLREGDKCVRWAGRPGDAWHGVADPFTEKTIDSGEAFAVFIRRECFSRLRHDFQIEVHDRGGTDTCHSVCNIF